MLYGTTTNEIEKNEFFELISRDGFKSRPKQFLIFFEVICQNAVQLRKVKLGILVNIGKEYLNTYLELPSLSETTMHELEKNQFWDLISRGLRIMTQAFFLNSYCRTLNSWANETCHACQHGNRVSKYTFRVSMLFATTTNEIEKNEFFELISRGELKLVRIAPEALFWGSYVRNLNSWENETWYVCQHCDRVSKHTFTVPKLFETTTNKLEKKSILGLMSKRGFESRPRLFFEVICQKPGQLGNETQHACQHGNRVSKYTFRVYKLFATATNEIEKNQFFKLISRVWVETHPKHFFGGHISET